MSRKCKVNWSDINGASPKPKQLHLEKDETDCLYHCPIQECGHDGFQSQRGCRKHVNTKHGWFYFFDQKPEREGLVASAKEDADDDKSSKIAIQTGRILPSFPASSQIAVKAHECLQKLQGSKGSEVDEDVHARIDGSTSSSTLSVETIENARKGFVLQSQRKLRRVMKFKSDEDDFLQKGINTHGYGQWTVILRDSDFKFQEGRTADGLKKRAGLKFS